MKRILWLFLIFGGFANYCYGWGQLGAGANIVTQDSGNRAVGISVTVSTSAATLVYSRTERDREIMIQNTDSTYTVYCGTFSAVSVTSGIPRWAIPPLPTSFTTNGNYHIYCILDPAAGSGTAEIIGSIEYDSRD